MNSFRLTQYPVKKNYNDIKIDFSKIKKGDIQEQQKLIEKYLLLIKTITSDEDLIQELIILLLQKAVFTCNDYHNFYKYFSTLARNYAINYYKHNKRRNHINYGEIKEIDFGLMEDIEKEYIKKENHKYLLKLIENLSPEYQLIIKNYYGLDCEEKTLAEIGDIIHRSTFYVWKKLHTILKQLYEKFLWDEAV